nr:transglutaminase domain-containing protein [Allomuricauda sp.]
MGKIRTLSLFALVGHFAFAQIATDYKKYQEQYPNSQSVRLSQETTLNIGLEDGQFVISQESKEVDLYLYESAKYDAKQSLNYSSFYELEKIEASSFVIKDDKYEELKVSDFKEKDELDGSFYDDVKSVNFIYPSLGKGAKTKLEYKQIIKNPRFLNAFYFGSFYPIENNRFTIVSDTDIHLRFQEFNMEGITVDFSEKNTRRQNIYTWEIKNVDEFRYDERAPDYKSILPHVIPIIVSYQDNGETFKLLDDVSGLYKWYYSLVKDLNSEPASEDLVALVGELTAGKENELEKVRAIYYWVQENVKYIAFEYALGGFVPREANEVFHKKYGDCKDNSSLLLQMLDIAGIQGNLTWLGTRSIPYSYDDVPTPSADNHMILHYEFEGNSYYLDATGRFNPIELPTSFIQGKEALISKGQNDFELKMVPIIDASKNTYVDRVELSLDGNNLKGKAKAELGGYGKIDFFYRLEKYKSETKLIDLYNSAFRKGNNSFQISSFTETNKYSYDKNFVVDYDFAVSNYAKQLGDEIYINLNLRKTIANLKTDKDRTVPLEHKYLDSIDYMYSLNIPEGYAVEYLPEGIDFSSPYFDSKITYELVNNQVVYKHNFKLNTLIFDIAAQKEVNKLVEKVEKQYKEVVVLKKK